MAQRTVIGVDSSTQSCKAVLCDADTGQVLATARAEHPDGTEVDPRHWERALEQALAGLPDGAREQAGAIAVGGQQHGMVALDEHGAVVRPALLWNDLRSAPDARDLVTEFGAQELARRTGSVPAASFTVTKLRWLRRSEPDNAARTRTVVLPHDHLTAVLTAEAAVEGPVTDRGDASGTGYLDPVTGRYDDELLVAALGHRPATPRVAGPAEIVGRTADGLAIAPGTGDNMAAALGLGLQTGDVVVSLGTSGTVFASTAAATADPTGIIAGFADAAGGFLPLVCTLNAARVLTATARMLGTDLAGLEALAAAAPVGAGGVTLLPYLDGERTPDLPDATGSLHGLTRTSMTPENIARAAVEGMLCGLADGSDALAAAGHPVRRVLLIGGAAASPVVRQSAATLFGVPVAVPPAAEYVALGAARQAAWALSGADAPPAWTVDAPQLDPTDDPAAREIRERYAALRHAQWGV